VDSQIEAKFEEQASLLEQLNGLFRVSPRVTREQFHRFVEKSLKRFPMITAVEWAPRIEGSQRAGFEDAQRREIPGFEIRERDAAGRLHRAGDRERYYPLAFVEPLAGNKGALGFDLASGPRRRPALEKAIQSGAIVATSPVRLAQATGLERTGVLLLSAVKEGAEVRGFVLTALEMHGFVEKLLSAVKPSLYLRLDDLDDHETLYDSFPPGGAAEAADERTLEYGNRHYRLLMAPTPAYLARHRELVGWGVLAAGLLGTGLLGGMLLLGTGHTARVEAQVVDRTRRLTESEAKLREITSTLGEGVYVMDEMGLVTFVNPEAQRLLGLTEEEVLGRNAHQLFHHHRADRAPFPEEECGIGRVRHLGETYRSEDEMFWRKDGSTFPVEVWSSAIVREGRAVGAVVAFTDITRRKQAEEAVRKAAQEVEDLYNHAPCGYHSLDEDGVFVRINDTELQWLGYRRGEVIGRMRFSDLLTPASLQTFQDNFPRFKARGYVQDLEFEMVRKDGTVFTALLNATAVREGDGHYLMSRSTVFDITARKQMEKALRESEERFRNTLEYAPIGVAVVSLGGQFLQVNRALCDILGYTRKEMEQLYFQDITHPDDLALDLSNVKGLLAGEIDSYQIEKRYIRKDGQAVWVQLTGTALRDARGEPLNLIAQVEDITERRRAQEQIRQLAYYDTLTGLPNRRLLMDRLQHDLDQARRFKRSLAIMFLDLDRFKQINDTLGHDVGDELCSRWWPRA
jgi:PAS domain S-box-containing protein